MLFRDKKFGITAFAGLLILLAASPIYLHAAQPLLPQPLIKIGSCPSGYSTSSGYCKPGNNGRFAIEKHGGCPSGYSTSGEYCLAGSSAKPAIHKQGGCPSGWISSSNYCLSTR